MADSIEIKIPSEPKFLQIIRATMSQIGETMGFSPEETKNITLAVDEACSNIIKHAYCGATEKPIHVTCTLYKNRLEILLKDFGRKANIAEIKSRELDDVRPGGLGVHLIKCVMDIVKYENLPDEGNQLQLVKFVQKK